MLFRSLPPKCSTGSQMDVFLGSPRVCQPFLVIVVVSTRAVSSRMRGVLQSQCLREETEDVAGSAGLLLLDSILQVPASIP